MFFYIKKIYSDLKNHFESLHWAVRISVKTLLSHFVVQPLVMHLWEIIQNFF